MLNRAKRYFSRNRKDIIDFLCGMGIWTLIIALILLAYVIGV